MPEGCPKCLLCFVHALASGIRPDSSCSEDEDIMVVDLMVRPSNPLVLSGNLLPGLAIRSETQEAQGQGPPPEPGVIEWIHEGQ